MSDAPPRLFRLLVPVAVVLAVAGVGAFYWASQRTGDALPEADVLTVTVTAQACEPMEITVPAGQRVFKITNESDRPVEWEILDGVMVVAERENIVPGLHQTLRVRLAPGDYAMTCGLLTNPRGVLHVVESAEWTAQAGTVELRGSRNPASWSGHWEGGHACARQHHPEALGCRVRGGVVESGTMSRRVTCAKLAEALADRLRVPSGGVLDQRIDDPRFRQAWPHAWRAGIDHARRLVRDDLASPSST